MAAVLFSSFHIVNTQLPSEIVYLIIQYAESDTPLPNYPMIYYPPIAYVSRALRDAYLNYLNYQSCVDFGIGKRPVPRIGEALSFPDLQTFARFFTNSPGRPGQFLAHVTYIRIIYRDDWAVPPWEYDVRYAYEAFELLVANFGRMRLQRLQIHIRSYIKSYAQPFGIDAPGVWSLLKIRGLQELILTSRHGEICPAVRRALQKRLRWPKSRPWKPIGLEDPGPGDWRIHVS
jgi:hypothetical protein